MGEWGLLHLERGSWCVVGKGPVGEPRAHTVELSVCLQGWRGGGKFPVMCRRDCAIPRNPLGPPGHLKQMSTESRDPYRACRSSLCGEIAVTGDYSLCPAPLPMRLHRPDPSAASSYSIPLRGRSFCPFSVGSHPFLFDVLHPNTLRLCS